MCRLYRPHQFKKKPRVENLNSGLLIIILIFLFSGLNQFGLFQTVLPFCCDEGICNEHGYGHWAYPFRNRRYCRSNFTGRLKVNIAYKPKAAFFGTVINPVYTYIYDDGAFFNHIGFDKLRFSHGCNQYVLERPTITTFAPFVSTPVLFKR